MNNRRRMLLSLAAMCAISSVACKHGSSKQESASHSTPPSQGRSLLSGSGEKDPCSLLEPKEVEAVLASTLAIQPFRSREGVPDYDGSGCKYEDGDLHSVTVDVQWEHGATLFKMFGALQSMVDQGTKGLVRLEDGSEVAGEWDEASVVGCCRFVALRSDQMVTVDVGGSTKTTISGAAKLADAALKRIDRRLSIDGSKNVQAAVDFETAHRPKRRDPCALVNRGDVEAVVGALAAEPTSVNPESDEGKCVYEHDVDGKFAAAYVMKVKWTGGFSEFRNHNAVFGSFSKSFAKGAPLSERARKGIESLGVGADLPQDPAWELAHWDVSGLFAVRRDVLVNIEPQGGSSDNALKLMVKAMSKL